jgi:hypothetical protein
LVFDVDVSTQALLQSISVLGQLVVHVPFEHPWPAAHAFPHPPQFAVDELVSTHLPEQLVSPPEHIAVWHVPPTHATPA